MSMSTTHCLLLLPLIFNRGIIIPTSVFNGNPVLYPLKEPACSPTAKMEQICFLLLQWVSFLFSPTPTGHLWQVGRTTLLSNYLMSGQWHLSVPCAAFHKNAQQPAGCVAFGRAAQCALLALRANHRAWGQQSTLHSSGGASLLLSFLYRKWLGSCHTLLAMLEHSWCRAHLCGAPSISLLLAGRLWPTAAHFSSLSIFHLQSVFRLRLWLLQTLVVRFPLSSKVPYNIILSPC